MDYGGRHQTRSSANKKLVWRHAEKKVEEAQWCAMLIPSEVHVLEEHQEEVKYIILSYYGRGISNHVSHYCGSCNLSAFGCAFIYFCYIST
ncbi:hypothetical protein PVAP13_2KG218050 [Panicum virgatum]|uniref:Uncharacterized protein n=1 Tax=Panicum virgatum TaxID=38727 RepID=A0A8T0W0T8_PANVG|nr:hypothetical protein PVAP13_2KG218050 [Panicum virgatum]